MPYRVLTGFKASASAGAGGAIVGAISHQELLTWVGVAVAVVSAIGSASVAGYHKIRDVIRQEDIADRQAAELAMHRQIAAQVEFEARIQSNAEKTVMLEQTLVELVERVRLERCPYLEEGHARCIGAK